jgi:hypothetical protein
VYKLFSSLVATIRDDLRFIEMPVTTDPSLNQKVNLNQSYHCQTKSTCHSSWKIKDNIVTLELAGTRVCAHAVLCFGSFLSYFLLLMEKITTVIHQI